MARDGDMAWATGKLGQDATAADVGGWQYELLTIADAELVQFQQSLTPPIEAGQAPPLPSAAQFSNARLFGTYGVPRSALGAELGAGVLAMDAVFAADAEARATTDVGDLFGKSPAVLGIGVQRRNPIVTDPRVRGSRVGSLAASGSHWVPARIDLDTVLSKIDSRVIDQTVVIKGPYSVIYGPAFSFFDVELLAAPRYAGGFEAHGATGATYHTNGEAWFGRQDFWGGAEDWGFRLGYGHRTGSDYEAGDGDLVPASYKSRIWNAALGANLFDQASMDATLLRLDQTDIELAGQAFDIDMLKTDGYEVLYLDQNRRAYDRLEVNAWYNRTFFTGSAQRPSKRAQFPIYDDIGFVGFTDVDSMSTGYRAAGGWKTANESWVTAGADLRYIKQELNELTSAFGQPTTNSPIPRSHSSNPGLFVEVASDIDEDLRVRAGSRVDWNSTNISEDPAKLAAVTPDALPYADVVGSGQFDQDDFLWASYLASSCRLTDEWEAGVSFGFAQRPPNLTERYAAEPFMFLLQNGLNTVTGAPDLDPERLWQLDAGLTCQLDRVRLGVNGFYGWYHDYITFENTGVVLLPPFATEQQENLKYVNTDFATLAGVELLGEWDAADWFTPFVTMRYVEGTDHTRDGEYATRPATFGSPSVRIYGLERGTFGDGGPAVEPLPGILPLEGRLGVRLHPTTRDHRNRDDGDDTPSSSAATTFAGAQAYDWWIELSARVVNDQSRVAASLRETPTPGFMVWDVRGVRRLTEGCVVIAGVENFTNKAFQEHLDFRSTNGIKVLQPGVNFYAGAELCY